MKIIWLLALLLALCLTFREALSYEDEDDGEDEDPEGTRGSGRHPRRKRGPTEYPTEDDDDGQLEELPSNIGGKPVPVEKPEEDEPVEDPSKPNSLPVSGEPKEPEEEPEDEPDSSEPRTPAPHPPQPVLEREPERLTTRPRLVILPSPIRTTPLPPLTRRSVILSKHKPVTQSSTAANGPPHLAVDGDYNQHYFSRTCTHTKAEMHPWWTVDLGRMHYIDKVKIWNRADCCGERLNSLRIQASDDNHHWNEIGVLTEYAKTAGIYDISTRGAMGRYVRLILSKSFPDALTLCEVEVHGLRARVRRTVATPAPPPAAPQRGPSILISRGKHVTQSSESSNGPPHLAVDGNYNQHYFSRSCTHTKAEVNPWWKIDLGVPHHLESVKVWNRVDCCGERLNSLKVQASNDNDQWKEVGALNQYATNGGIYHINTNGIGRFVRLILTKGHPEALTLCEVEIYGAAVHGFAAVTPQSRPQAQAQHHGNHHRRQRPHWRPFWIRLG